MRVDFTKLDIDLRDIFAANQALVEEIMELCGLKKSSE
jgi:hypothetical protein